MKTIVAVIDAGGRGSALIDAYAKSDKVDELIAIPGNDLMRLNTSKKVHIHTDLKTTSKDEILKICKKFNVALVDVAQDNAVEAGVGDLLRENGFKVVGPSRSAGQIEWDKSSSRDFMERYKLPIPAYKAFNTAVEGTEYVYSEPEQPWVVKASGLAEGKGVILTSDIAGTVSAINMMSKFGSSGTTYLLESRLDGEEFSAYAISDGESFQYIGNAQDHKRVFDGDEGPNTGGMGCSTPALVVNKEIEAQVLSIFQKTFEGLKQEKRPYQGILYLGGIVVSGKVFIIEFNARWGDPEVQCILPGIKNDWFEVGITVAEGKLNSIKIIHDGKSRIVVACASYGYPNDYSRVKGKEILGLDKLIKTPGIKVYGAGVKAESGKYYAQGGRLFFVVAEGKDVIEAREKVYKALEKVSIQGDNGENLLHYRKDIGFKDVNRLMN